MIYICAFKGYNTFYTLINNYIRDDYTKNNEALIEIVIKELNCKMYLCIQMYSSTIHIYKLAFG